MKSLFKRLDTSGHFPDFKHTAKGQRDNKKIRSRKERRMLKEEQEAIEFAREFMSDAVHETAKQFRRQEGRWSGMNTKKKNALFGRYPSCDMLNNALRFIHEGKIDDACSEIVFAIEKADGYFHEDVVPIVEKVKSYWVKTHWGGR